MYNTHKMFLEEKVCTSFPVIIVETSVCVIGQWPTAYMHFCSKHHPLCISSPDTLYYDSMFIA